MFSGGFFCFLSSIPQLEFPADNSITSANYLIDVSCTCEIVIEFPVNTARTSISGAKNFANLDLAWRGCLRSPPFDRTLYTHKLINLLDDFLFINFRFHVCLFRAIVEKIFCFSVHLIAIGCLFSRLFNWHADIERTLNIYRSFEFWYTVASYQLFLEHSWWVSLITAKMRASWLRRRKYRSISRGRKIRPIFLFPRWRRHKFVFIRTNESDYFKLASR